MMNATISMKPRTILAKSHRTQSCGRSAVPAMSHHRIPPISRKRSMIICNSSIVVTETFGYVLASVAFSAISTYYLGIKVAIARKKYDVAYPTMYATGDSQSAKTFNCIQRAHQNTLETLPSALAIQLALGIVHPITAAALGVAWSIGRLIYAQGYSTGDPKQRAPGSAVSGIVFLVMIIATFYSGIKLLV